MVKNSKIAADFAFSKDFDFVSDSHAVVSAGCYAAMWSVTEMVLPLLRIMF